MTEKQAIAIADALGGDTWQSGGGVWLVLFRRPDGRIVAITDEAICQYSSDQAFDEGRTDLKIALL